MLLKYAFKELKHDQKFALFFVLNVSIGLLAFVSLSGFQSSLNQTLETKSKTMLGADFGISSRRPIVERENQIIEDQLGSNYQKTDMLETFSMIQNQKGDSRLFQIKAIEKNFPFYGSIQLTKDQKISAQGLENLSVTQGVWVYPEVLLQLEVSVGDPLTIGSQIFTIEDVIKEDQTAGMSSDFAPRIYMTTNQLINTGLIQPGSLVWYSTLYKLDTKTNLQNLYQVVSKAIDNPEVKIFTHQDASQQMARLMEILSDFLGLASLVALFLAAVGLYYLFQNYIHQRFQQMAIFISLGLQPKKVLALTMIQILLLGALGACVAVFLAWLCVPFLIGVFQGVLPFSVDFHIDVVMLSTTFLLGVIGSLLVCSPLLVQVRTIKIKTLLDQQSRTHHKKDWLWKVLLLSNALLFWVCSVMISHSFRVGSLFFGLFALSILFLMLIAKVIFIVLEKLTFNHPTSLKWAIRDTVRNPFVTLISFLSIGIGILLLNLIPQLQNTLDAQLQIPSQSKVPSLFFFDIQPEQVEPLEQIMQSMDQSFNQLTPMVRSRLVQVNGKPFEKTKKDALTREEQREARFRNRGMNLTYQSALKPSERIIKGEPFGAAKNKDMHEVSLEKRFAKRLGIKIGDVLTFSVESVEVTGIVVNLRSVTWTTFEPNFFIVFEPGVLEGAPKTYLATAKVDQEDQKNELQNKVVQSLPNISILDVSRLVLQLKNIMDQMAKALALMAYLCLLAGMMVLYLIASHHTEMRKKDIGLLKALGASFSSIQQMILWQFGLVVFFACLSGVAISMFLSLVLSHILFESMYVLDWTMPLASTLLGTIVMVGIVWMAVYRTLQVSAHTLFLRSH